MLRDAAPTMWILAVLGILLLRAAVQPAGPRWARVCAMLAAWLLAEIVSLAGALYYLRAGRLSWFLAGYALILIALGLFPLRRYARDVPGYYR